MTTLLLTAAALIAMLGIAVWAVRSKSSGGPELDKRLQALAEIIRDENRKDREELRSAVAAAMEPLRTTLADFGQGQTGQLAAMRKEAVDGREILEAAQKRHLDGFSEAQSKRSGETVQSLKELGERLEAALKLAHRGQRQEAGRDPRRPHREPRQAARGQ